MEGLRSNGQPLSSGGDFRAEANLVKSFDFAKGFRLRGREFERQRGNKDSREGGKQKSANLTKSL